MMAFVQNNDFIISKTSKKPGKGPFLISVDSSKAKLSYFHIYLLNIDEISMMYQFAFKNVIH